jgi:hypothetical protein
VLLNARAAGENLPCNPFQAASLHSVVSGAGWVERA